jgi:hypothetical protein
VQRKDAGSGDAPPSAAARHSRSFWFGLLTSIHRCVVWALSGTPRKMTS